MTEEIDRFKRNIKKLEGIIQDIEEQAAKITDDEEKFKELEQKLNHFQDYKHQIETWLSLIEDGTI